MFMYKNITLKHYNTKHWHLVYNYIGNIIHNSELSVEEFLVWDIILGHDQGYRLRIYIFILNSNIIVVIIIITAILILI